MAFSDELSSLEKRVSASPSWRARLCGRCGVCSLRRIGYVVVDYVCDVGDVEASGGDVGGYEDGAVAVFEGVEGLFAFRLCSVGVECGDFVVVAGEPVGEAVCVYFGAGEYEDALVVECL